MEWTIGPSKILIGIMAALLLVIIAAMILKPGQGQEKRTALVILAVVYLVVGILFLRPCRLTADSSGFSSTAYGRIRFTWEEVAEARRIDGLKSSPYAPAYRINGGGGEDLRAGTYKLENGEKAKVVLQDPDNAYLIRTHRGHLYLLSVRPFGEFAGILEAHLVPEP